MSISEQQKRILFLDKIKEEDKEKVKARLNDRFFGLYVKSLGYNYA